MPQMTQRAREEAAFLFDDNIIAKPLAAAGLEAARPKNLNIHLCWVNITFNGGQMYEEAKAKGYVNALPLDAEVPGIAFADGAFKSSGMLLMKIDRALAKGAEKASVLRAMRQGSSEEDNAMAKRNLEEALKSQSGPAELKRKMSTFSPTPKEMSGLPGMADLSKK